MLKEPADTLDGIELGGARSCTAGFTIGEGDGAVLEGDDAAIGDGDPEDRGGEGREGGGPVRVGLTLDIPVGVPDLWVDAVKESGFGHLLFEDGSVDGREGFHGDKEGVSGRSPLGVVHGEATTWDHGVDVGVVLELPTPGMQDAGQARQIGADETLVFGEAFEGTPFNIGIAGRAARTSVSNRYCCLRRFSVVSQPNRIESGRGNLNPHVERAGV